MTLWNPLSCPDWDAETTSPSTIGRLKKDISEIFMDPPPGILILPDENDITKMQAILTGPSDTPYEGGYFLFAIRCPPNYPIKPPRVRLMTTGGGLVRFNPNFYKSGKVCLSILGTWSGPSWSPVQTLSTLLISIQSLMNENPYHNEPGHMKERNSGDSRNYNDCIRHETLRVAVCDMMNAIPSLGLSKHAVGIMRASFLSSYEVYVATCKKYRKLDGKAMQDPYKGNGGVFHFGRLLSRLEKLKDLAIAETPSTDDPVDDE